MTQKNENRRVRMTKRLMKDALLELLEYQSLAGISVTAICKKADVHRTTFYNYYNDPTELLWEIEQDILNRIPSPPEILDQENQKTLLATTAEFFDYIQDNKKTVRILFSEHCGDSFTTRLIEFLLNGYIPVDEDSDELTARVKQLYIANGTVGIMREWVNSDFPLSSEKIAELMYSLSKKIASSSK